MSWLWHIVLTVCDVFKNICSSIWVFTYPESVKKWHSKWLDCLSFSLYDKNVKTNVYLESWHVWVKLFFQKLMTSSCLLLILAIPYHTSKEMFWFGSICTVSAFLTWREFFHIVTVYVLIFLFSGSLHVFRFLDSFLSCFFPCHVKSHSSHLFSVSQLHVITNHFPTVFSFQVQSHSWLNPHFTLHVHATVVKVRFCHMLIYSLVCLYHT